MSSEADQWLGIEEDKEQERLMSEHTTEETLMYLRQCLLPGNVQDGIDLEIPSWLVRDAATALESLEAKLSKMEEAQTEAKKLMDDTLDRAEQNPPDDACLGDEAWWKQRTRFAREALAGGADDE